MFYSKEELEKLRLKGEEEARKLEEERMAKEEGFLFESAANILIRCNHCGHDRFERGSALMNTRGLTFLDLDWLNEAAHTLMCKHCGLIHWFGKEVKQKQQ